MANIRKVDAPKVAKQQQIASEVREDSVPLLKGRIELMLKDGVFSQKESRDLETILKVRPELKAELGAHLKDQLELRQKAGAPVAISEMALSKLGQTLGLDLKELFFRKQSHSGVATHEVNQGLEKTAKTAVDEHDVEKQKIGSDNRLAKQQAILDGKNGVVDRPIGGSKGAAYDAVGVLAEHVEGKIDARLGVETKAAKDVLREPLIKTGTAVIAEMKKGDTLKHLGDLTSQIGKPGFKEALSTAAGSVGADVVTATNMTAVNTEAVDAFVKGTSSSAARLAALTKGTKLEGIVAQHAPKLVDGVTKLGAKVAGTASSTASTVASTASATASTASTVASTAAAASSAASTAASVAQAGTLAAEGVQVGAAGAKAAGQSVPILGQALGVVTTGLATAELVGHCRQQPKDWKRIVSAGANVIGQAVGIFIPFVGAATTVGKLAADAAMGAHDKKVGRETAQVGVHDIAPHVDNATSLLSPFLEAAGYGDAAGKMRNYNEQLQKLKDTGATSTSFAQMKPAEREEMMQTLAAAGAEIEKAAPEAKGTPQEASMTLLGEAFKQLLGVWRKSKNVDSAEDPEAEKKKLAGEAMEAAAKATAAKAVSDV